MNNEKLRDSELGPDGQAAEVFNIEKYGLAKCFRTCFGCGRSCWYFGKTTRSKR